MNDIKGLEIWEGETKEYNRTAGRLKMKAGVGIIDALEAWYAGWQTKQTPRGKREYLLWRLRLHLRHNADPDFLNELDEFFDIGLRDEEIGDLMWDIPAETATGFTTGFNWRKDSGNALRGGTIKEEEDEVEEEDYDDDDD